MSNLALVTGASSGIGRELARYHAGQGGDLIVVARRDKTLEALKDELESAHGITVHIVVADLGDKDGPQGVIDTVAAMGLDVDILINNAGSGGQGRHIDRDVKAELGMIDLNVKATVALTHHFGRQMAKRGRGRILQVGSTAGFIPGPNQAIYFSTKNFVNSYSLAMDEELRRFGVTCSVLAPGYVETEFAQVADTVNTQLVNNGGDTPQRVAKLGYQGMMRGQLVIMNQWTFSFMQRFVLPFLPRRMLLKMVAKSQAKEGEMP